MLVRIREIEGCETQPSLYWDTVWTNRPDISGGFGDWILAGEDDPQDQRGGLRARMALLTAVVICLFTDRRLPDDMPAPTPDGDPRGWWGDSIKLEGEPDVPMGSLLWTLERSTISDETAKLAQQYAEEALEILITQGAAAEIVVEAWVERSSGMLGLSVALFSQAGDKLADQQFDLYWQQTRDPAPMMRESVY